MGPQKIVIAGTAGYARELIDIVQAVNAKRPESFELLGALDPNPTDADLARLRERHIPYLGAESEWLERNGESSVRFIIGIGSPRVKARVDETFTAGGLAPVPHLIHPSAWVGSLSVLEPGSVVAQGAVVTTGVRIGRHVHLNLASTVGHDTRIGDYAAVQPHGSLSGNVTVEDGVLIGTSACIIEGVRICAGSVVGAGACVTRDVPPGVIAKGVPARW